MMLKFLKRLVAGEELRALERYRYACSLIYRWNGNVPNSVETATWINEVGEKHRPADIGEFRERLMSGDAARILPR